MRPPRIHSESPDRLVVESSGVSFIDATLDRAAGTIELAHGIRLPLIGSWTYGRSSGRIADFDHLRIYTYWGRQDGDGGSDPRFGVVIEGAVDETKLAQLFVAGKDGLLLASCAELAEAHDVANAISVLTGLRILVPERLRLAGGLR